MSRFEPVTIAWAGVDFTIPADRVLKAIALIEDHVTYDELQSNAVKGTLPLSKISQAFAAVLGFAGARVSAEDVYAGMFSGGEVKEQITLSIIGLMSMMIPPVHLRKDLTGNRPAPAGNSGALSRQHGKPRSRRVGSRRKNSGS